MTVLSVLLRRLKANTAIVNMRSALNAIICVVEMHTATDLAAILVAGTC